MTAAHPAPRGTAVPPTGGRSRRLWGNVVLVAVLGVGGGLLFRWIVALASYRGPTALFIATGIAVAAGCRLAVAVRPAPDPLPVPAEEDAGSYRNGFDLLSILEHRLSWGSFDAERYEARLRPRLRQLAQERLQRRHGVDPVRQPDLARQIVGEDLWQLMTGPAAKAPPSRSQLTTLLDALEAI
jgi:hypothetical protein